MSTQYCRYCTTLTDKTLKKYSNNNSDHEYRVVETIPHCGSEKCKQSHEKDHGETEGYLYLDITEEFFCK